MSNDIIECMGSSKKEFVKCLFRNDKKYAEAFNKEAADPSRPGGSKKKRITVSSEFKDASALAVKVRPHDDLIRRSSIDFYSEPASLWVWEHGGLGFRRCCRKADIVAIRERHW